MIQRCLKVSFLRINVGRKTKSSENKDVQNCVELRLHHVWLIELHLPRTRTVVNQWRTAALRRQVESEVFDGVPTVGQVTSCNERSHRLRHTGSWCFPLCVIWFQNGGGSRPPDSSMSTRPSQSEACCRLMSNCPSAWCRRPAAPP